MCRHWWLDGLTWFLPGQGSLAAVPAKVIRHYLARGIVWVSSSPLTGEGDVPGLWGLAYHEQGPLLWEIHALQGHGDHLRGLRLHDGRGGQSIPADGLDDKASGRRAVTTATGVKVEGSAESIPRCQEVNWRRTWKSLWEYFTVSTHYSLYITNPCVYNVHCSLCTLNCNWHFIGESIFLVI